MRVARPAAIAAVVALMLTAHHFGLLARFRDPVQLKQTLLGLGAWGYLSFIMAYTALQPFGVPGTVFVVVAPLIWPWPVAFALSMVGTCGASVVGFSFARFVARDWVARRMSPRFHAWEDALARRAFATVFLLRLIFWMPQVLHTFFGLSKVSFGTHLAGSAAGYVLPLLVISYFGQSWVDTLLAAPLSFWVRLGLGVVATAAVMLLVRWRRQRARQSCAPG